MLTAVNLDKQHFFAAGADVLFHAVAETAEIVE